MSIKGNTVHPASLRNAYKGNIPERDKFLAETANWHNWDKHKALAKVKPLIF